MIALCLALIAVSFGVSLPATWAVRAGSRRLGAWDGAGVTGQVKDSARRVPNTGGIGIVAAFTLCVAAGLAAASTQAGADLAVRLVPDIGSYIAGIRGQTAAAAALLGCVLVLHVVGLIDDRRALGPYLKLLVMLGVAAAAVVTTHTRLLTLLDSRVGGPWLSITLTVLWIGVITNAFNFLDNMDGLAGGVAAICAAFFLATALTVHQWFISAALALLLGAVLGFLVFNFPFRDGKDGERGASIFMGDGGSLVIGFVLAFLSVRITYVRPADVSHPATTPWWGVFIPLIILAVPLYDFCSVMIIRCVHGRSPLVGDLRHFSHRLVGHGLSKRNAVLVIYGATAATGIGAVSLPRLEWWQALLVGVQTVLVIGVIALYEWSRVPGNTAQPRPPYPSALPLPPTKASAQAGPRGSTRA